MYPNVACISPMIISLRGTYPKEVIIKLWKHTHISIVDK